MANYIGTARTNYFHVTDEDKYNHLFKGLVGTDDEVLSFDKTDKDGKILHGFGTYGSVLWSASKADGNPNWQEDDDYDDFDTFLNEMKTIIPEDEAFVLMETGHEKLRYLVGHTTLVTKKDIQHIDLSNMAGKLASAMLQKPDYKLHIEY